MALRIDTEGRPARRAHLPASFIANMAVEAAILSVVFRRFPYAYLWYKLQNQRFQHGGTTARN